MTKNLSTEYDHNNLESCHLVLTLIATLWLLCCSQYWTYYAAVASLLSFYIKESMLLTKFSLPLSVDVSSRFMGLFFNAMRDSEKSTNLAKRLEILNTFFTYLLYCNISRSLFEKDKMLLSFLICATIWLKQGKIIHEEFTFFVIGGLTLSGEQPKNPVKWLADKLWLEMINLSSIPNFTVSCVSSHVQSNNSASPFVSLVFWWC